MSHHSPTSLFVRSFFLPLILCIPLQAADEPKTVLSTTTVNLGTHSVTYQRVEPPVAAASTAVASAASTASRAEALSRRSLLLPDFLSLSCTVHDTGVTSVRWWHEGAEYRVVSSIDFNELRALGGFEAEGRSYTVFMGIGNAMPASTLARLQAGGAVLPASVTEPAPVLPASVLADIAQNGGSRYVVLSSPEGGADAEAFRGIDALHRYFDAHKAELIAQAAENEARQREQEAYLKANPPVPQDTVIQFWPKKGSRYLNAAASAADASASGKEGK